jgi:hypothetical protein
MFFLVAFRRSDFRSSDPFPVLRHLNRFRKEKTTKEKKRKERNKERKKQRNKETKKEKSNLNFIFLS